MAELGRLGPKGRKTLVDSWANYLPVYNPGDSHGFPSQNVAPTSNTSSPSHQGGERHAHEDEEEDEEEEGTEGTKNGKIFSIHYTNNVKKQD